MHITLITSMIEAVITSILIENHELTADIMTVEWMFWFSYWKQVSTNSPTRLYALMVLAPEMLSFRKLTIGDLVIENKREVSLIELTERPTCQIRIRANTG